MYHKLAYLLLFGSRLLRSIFKMIFKCFLLGGHQSIRLTERSSVRAPSSHHQVENSVTFIWIIWNEYSLNQRWAGQVMSKHQLAIYDNWYHITRLYYKRSLGPWRSWTRVSTQLWPPPNSLYPNRMNHLPLRYSWYLPRLPKLIWNKIKISA